MTLQLHYCREYNQPDLIRRREERSLGCDWRRRTCSLLPFQQHNEARLKSSRVRDSPGIGSGVNHLESLSRQHVQVVLKLIQLFYIGASDSVFVHNRLLGWPAMLNEKVAWRRDPGGLGVPERSARPGSLSVSLAEWS